MAERGNGPGVELVDADGTPVRRVRLPVVSLTITTMFLTLGVLLVWFLRVELLFFFESSGPRTKFAPLPDRPVPVTAPSNVYAEARFDHRTLCDYWDVEKSPFPPEVSYSFTLEMGFGNRYYLTCVGDGSVRPRLWILRPETPAETKAIHRQAIEERLGRTMLDNWTTEPVPEIHVPGGSACVNDLCRGRLVRFSDLAANPLGGIRKLQTVFAERLQDEFRRTGRPPLEDGDFLFILGEEPRDNWWYVGLVGLVMALTLVNLVLGVRFLRRYLAAKRTWEAHLAKARAADSGAD